MKTGIWIFEIYEYAEGTVVQEFFKGKPTVEKLLSLDLPDNKIVPMIEAVHKDGYVRVGHYILDLYEIEVEDVEHADPNKAQWQEFEGIVKRCMYKPGWYFRTGIEHGGPDGSRMWLQVGVTEEAEISWDMVEDKKVPWRGAKHYLSPHMCRNEVVSTLYHAIERAELHEVKEWFRYAPVGKTPRALFNPHLDPDVLAEAASKKSSFNMRDNAMTMEETPGDG